MVFQFAGLPELSSWAMISGGIATVVFRAGAVRLEEKQGSVVRYQRTSTSNPFSDSSIRLTEEQQRKLLEKLQEEIESMENDDQHTNDTAASATDLSEKHEEQKDREVNTKTE
ncbi:hypothetical protein C471_05546 [Halorubrum saccharovorum DSM 1137]|uniref:Uncharacterized protein n=2 Tax=Halorubrum saccharovorum TaxID=2248 RepID=M0E3S7_9EURY|nr:hypothetical protein C471_05546 [Halorubrum saccharovorum DSM 1137]